MKVHVIQGAWHLPKHQSQVTVKDYGSIVNDERKNYEGITVPLAWPTPDSIVKFLRGMISLRPGMCLGLC